MNEHHNSQSAKKPKVHDSHKISVDLSRDESLAEAIKPPVTNTHKKGSARRWLFVIAGLVFVLVVINVVASLLVHKTKTAPLHFSSVSTVIDKLQPNLDGVTLKAVTTDALGGRTDDGYPAYTLPGYTLQGNQYATVPSKGSGVGIMSNKTVSSHNYEVLENYFTKVRFKEVNSQIGSGIPVYLSKVHGVKVISYKMYESGSIRCAIWRMDISNSQLDKNITSVGCADKLDYQKVADQVKPFAEAYGTDDTIAGRIFGVPVIKDGSNGYKSATIYQGIIYNNGQPDDDFDSVDGLYYKEPNKEWTLFHLAVRNSTPECSSFNTDVLKKSFAGTTCYDATSQKENKV